MNGSERLDAAKGCLLGTAIGVLMWAVIIILIKEVLL